jgi:malate synthase
MGEAFGRYRWDEARRLFEMVALADHFDEFLTLPAYQKID